MTAGHRRSHGTSCRRRSTSWRKRTCATGGRCMWLPPPPCRARRRRRCSRARATAALVIIALAGPTLNYAEQTRGEGEVIILIDDGWTSAQSWDELQATFDKLAEENMRDGRQMYVVAASAVQGEATPALQPLTDRQAFGIASALEPKSWTTSYSDLPALLPRLEAFSNPEFIWLSGGILPDDGAPALREFLGALASIGPLTIYHAGEPAISPIIKAPTFAGEQLTVPL